MRVARWEHEVEVHQDHGGADMFHHIVCGDRHVAEVATEADARLIVKAVNDADKLAEIEAMANEWIEWSRTRSTPRIDTFRDVGERILELLAREAGS